jgi:hypothetical protein
MITQCEQFPRGKHDDLVDTMTQALRYLRESGMLSRPEEVASQAMSEGKNYKPLKWVYDV